MSEKEVPKHINGGTVLIAEVCAAYIASKTGRPRDEVRGEVQRIFSEELAARAQQQKPEKEAPPVDPDYLFTNADMGFPPTFRGFRNADFFADKLGMTIEEVQKLYREDREEFYRRIDAQGLRITVKPEDL